MALLGGDRLASRNEIRKLALYAQGKERVELADVLAVVSDASDAGARRRDRRRLRRPTPREVESEFAKARAGGASPAAIVSAAIRQVANLHKMRLAIDGGDSDRVRHEARRAAGAFHPREGGRRGLARLDAAAAAARHGAARRGLARGPPQRAARRGHRPAHAAVDRGERAAARADSAREASPLDPLAG